jgi:hypothetical protein
LEQAEVVTVEPSSGVTAEATTQTDIDATTAQDTTVYQQATSGVTGTSGQIRQESQAASTQTTRNRTTRNELPRTATFDPLVGMIGLMSLGGFIALRMRTR